MKTRTFTKPFIQSKNFTYTMLAIMAALLIVGVFLVGLNMRIILMALTTVGLVFSLTPKCNEALSVADDHLVLTAAPKQDEKLWFRDIEDVEILPKKVFFHMKDGTRHQMLKGFFKSAEWPEVLGIMTGLKKQIKQ